MKKIKINIVGFSTLLLSIIFINMGYATESSSSSISLITDIYTKAFITNFANHDKINAKLKEAVSIEGVAEPETKVSVNLNYQMLRLMTIDQDKDNIIMDFINPLNKNMYNETAAIATYDESNIGYRRRNTGVIASGGLDSLSADSKALFIDLDPDPITGLINKKFNYNTLDELTKSDNWKKIKEEDKTKILDLWKGSHALTYKVAKDSIIYLNACRSYRRADFKKIPESINWSPSVVQLDEKWRDNNKAITPQTNVLNIDNDKSGLTKMEVKKEKINSGWEAKVLKNGCVLAITVKDNFKQSFAVKMDQDSLIIDMEVSVVDAKADGVIPQTDLDKALATVPFLIESKSLTFRFDDFERKNKNDGRFLNVLDDDKEDKDNEINKIIAKFVSKITKLEVYDVLDNNEVKIADVNIPADRALPGFNFLNYELTVNQPGTYKINFLGSDGKPVSQALSGFTLIIPWIDMDKTKMIVLAQADNFDKSLNNVPYSIDKGVLFDYSELEDASEVADLRNYFGLNQIYTVESLSSIEDKSFVPPINSEGFVDNSFIRYKFNKKNITDNLIKNANGAVDQHLAFYFLNTVPISEEIDKKEVINDTAIIFTAGQELAIAKDSSIKIETSKNKFINVANEVITTDATSGNFRTNCVNTFDRCDAKDFVVKYALLPIDATYLIDTFYKSTTLTSHHESSVSMTSNKADPIALTQFYPKLATKLNSTFNPSTPVSTSASQTSASQTSASQDAAHAAPLTADQDPTMNEAEAAAAAEAYAAYAAAFYNAAYAAAIAAGATADDAAIAAEAATERSTDPIIHIYPTQNQIITIELFPQVFTYSKPNYTFIGGWKVQAKPNGDLINLADNTNINYLEWEGLFLEDYNNDKTGFIVKNNEVELFLENKLDFIGLNKAEIINFIAKIKPNLPNNNYIYFHFVDNKYLNKQVPLVITPIPESLLRVYLQFKGLDQKIFIPEQELTKIPRIGYTVVEYGFLQ